MNDCIPNNQGKEGGILCPQTHCGAQEAVLSYFLHGSSSICRVPWEYHLLPKCISQNPCSPLQNLEHTQPHSMWDSRTSIRSHSRQWRAGTMKSAQSTSLPRRPNVKEHKLGKGFSDEKKLCGLSWEDWRGGPPSNWKTQSEWQLTSDKSFSSQGLLWEWPELWLDQSTHGSLCLYNFLSPSMTHSTTFCRFLRQLLCGGAGVLCGEPVMIQAVGSFSLP